MKKSLKITLWIFLITLDLVTFQYSDVLALLVYDNTHSNRIRNKKNPNEKKKFMLPIFKMELHRIYILKFLLKLHFSSIDANE